MSAPPKVNSLYIPYQPAPIPPPTSIAADPDKLRHAREILQRADQQMTDTELRTALREHSLFTWSASDNVDYILADHGEGIYFWDTQGKRYLDFNSQAMCLNLGFSNPEIVEAVREQMTKLPYVYPCVNAAPIKAQLSRLLADICPGDLQYFFYTTGGAESNETAIRMARLYTGRHKVIARYRSYHGASMGAMSLTGDYRRWKAEPAISGVVHIHNEFPYTFAWGTTEEEIARNALTYLRETIEYEGPNNIAAIVLEPIVGTNGVLIPPKGYLEGVRALCDQFKILMICDEVMSGFGRTGRLFGFMHTDPCIVPDIVTMAKGINGAMVPLGCVACRNHVAEFFRKNPIAIGSTYNSHPVSLASSFAALKYILKHDIIGNSARMGLVMTEHLRDLSARHPCIMQARNIGLFGIIDLHNPATPRVPLTQYNGPLHPASVAMKRHCLGRGLFLLFRWNQIYCNPPLIITAEQLREAFTIIDEGLTIVDSMLATPAPAPK